jgi:hypothetical protein
MVCKIFFSCIFFNRDAPSQQVPEIEAVTDQLLVLVSQGILISSNFF